MKRALITGINGMDGSHLADLLLKKGYEVYGMERRSSSKNRTNTAPKIAVIALVSHSIVITVIVLLYKRMPKKFGKKKRRVYNGQFLRTHGPSECA